MGRKGFRPVVRMPAPVHRLANVAIATRQAATIFIADEMAIDPTTQVLTAAGYDDGVVPATAIDWDMQHVSDPTGGKIPQSQMQSDTTRVLSPRGHMAHADDARRQQMHGSRVGFHAKATTRSIPSVSPRP
ncbi:hypothetical protein C3E98_041905, partial [Pseudomonas sp. MWU13-2625]